MQAMGRFSMHSKCVDFFLLSFGGPRIFFHFSFVPNMFLSSSQYAPWVPNVFPKGFPNSTRFNPTCFAQSPLLLTYIGGQKGEACSIQVPNVFPKGVPNST